MIRRVRQSFSHQPAPAADALIELVQTPDVFAAELSRLDANESSRLGRDKKRCRAIVDATLAADKIASAGAFQRFLENKPVHKKVPSLTALAQKAWDAGKPEMAMLLVQCGQRTALAYAARFPEARAAWVRLVDDCFLSVARFAENFVPTVAELDTWLDAGILAPSECVQLFASQSALLKDLGTRRVLDFALLCENAPRHRKAAVASALLQNDLAVGAKIFHDIPRLNGQATQLLMQHAISFETFIASVPRPELAEGRALLGGGHITPWQALALGVLTDAEIEQGVDEGMWTATQVVDQGPISDALARSWTVRGQVSQQNYMAGSLRVWRPADALPLAHVRLACGFDTLQMLVTHLPLPGDLATRRAYAERMGAAQVQGIDAYLGTLSESAAACAVCDEALDATHVASKQAACSHEASICIPCAQLHVQSTALPLCHDSACHKPYTPNDAARLLQDPHELAGVLLAGRRAPTTESWIACNTWGCIGGEPQVGHADFKCRICDKVTLHETFDVRHDRALVQRLVAGMASDQRLAGFATIRECYHCGVPTERNDGCPRMGCTHCHQDWDYNEGAFGVAEYGRSGAQRYVPRAGLLLRAGLFGDLAAGSTGIEDLPARVAAEAERMGLHLDVLQPPGRLNPLRRRRLAITAAR